VILKYTADEARNLKTYGELPDTSKRIFLSSLAFATSLTFFVACVVHRACWSPSPHQTLLFESFSVKVNESSHADDDDDIVFDDVSDESDDDVSLTLLLTRRPSRSHLLHFLSRPLQLTLFSMPHAVSHAVMTTLPQAQSVYIEQQEN
jgi:hypothetical protein